MKIRTKVIAACLMIVMAYSLTPSTALASSYAAADGSALPLTAQAVTKAIKKQDFTTKTRVIEKKATTVTKGTTKMNAKKGMGYIKFTAPQTKKFSFTFSDAKEKGDHAAAFVMVQARNASLPDHSSTALVATKGGTDHSLFLALNGHKGFTGELVTKPLASRTGTIKLKKGQPIYFFFYSSYPNTTFTLNVK